MAAHAGDAEDFVAADSSQQAALLETWAAHPEPARIELINAPAKRPVDPQWRNQDPAPEQPPARPDRHRRRRPATALPPMPRCAWPPPSNCKKSAKPAQLKFLDQQLTGENQRRCPRCPEPGPGQSATGRRRSGRPPGRRAPARRERRPAGPHPPRRPAATRGRSRRRRAHRRRNQPGASQTQADDRRMARPGLSGLSLGSILLLAALGLAITFGLLGVINMAHGEMLMLGAYATYVVQLLFHSASCPRPSSSTRWWPCRWRSSSPPGSAWPWNARSSAISTDAHWKPCSPPGVSA